MTNKIYRRCPKCKHRLKCKVSGCYCVNGYCDLFATGPIKEGD